MSFVSTEGVDPCHEEELQPGEDPCTVTEPETAPVAEAPGLQLQWTGSELVRSIVMSEVLTRPCDRKR